MESVSGSPSAMPLGCSRSSRIVFSCGPERFLSDRDRLPHLAGRFEEPQQHDVVGEVAEIDRRLHLPDQPVLRDDRDRQDAVLAQEHEQLVQLRQQKALLGHRVEVAVQAVDDDDRRVIPFDRRADAVRELARRHLGRDRPA